MKKVLILVNHDVVIYNFRLEIVERLLKDNFEVYISSPYGERIDDLIQLGCYYIETKISRHGTNILEDLNLFLHYKNLLQDIRPNVVLTFTIKPNIYGGLACRLLNVPYIANITGLGTAVENGGIMQQITSVLYKVALKKANCVFFQNKENLNFFANKRIALGKHELLPGSGVNLNRFSLLEYPPDNIIRFVFISRIMKKKGIDQYLEAAEYIKRKYPDTEFHICGFCEEDYEDILKSYQHRGIIIYHGMVRNVAEILKNMHCTVHPTYYPEGMSNVLLESLACGRPIITTDRSGCKEIVDDEVNGFIVEQENSQDLIEKIEKFIKLSKESKRQMGLQGRNKVEREFDRQFVVEKYMNKISNALV